MKFCQKAILLAFPILFFCPFLSAQVSIAPDTHLESPYNSIYVHLYYLQADSYQPAIAAQSLSPIADSSKMVQLAIQLKQILDGQGLFVHLNLLPQQSDYIDSLTHKAYYTPFPNRMPQVYLEKVGKKWVYSSETVQLIPKLHKDVFPFGTDLLLNIFPKAGNQFFLGLALWQYLAILFLLVITWLLFQILSRLLMPIVNQIAKTRIRSEQIDSTLLLKIARIISLLLLIQFVKIFIPALQLPITATEFTIIAVNIILTVLLVVLALRILNLVMSYATKYAESTEHKLDEQLLPILRRIMSILFVLGGVIQVLRLLDVNVTALIAGLSIGGLALALAAQDTVKNLIGSAMIFIDQPFQIGDYIEVGGNAGTVMEVGFRTTRIRTSDTSVISIPNGTIANMAITNKGMRVYRLFSTMISITYDTPPPLIEKYIQGLQQIIQHHPHTRKEGYYVHLNELAASSLNILFRVYLEVPDYSDELKAKEEILLNILQWSNLLGVRLAFPSSTLYVEELPDGKTTKAVYPTTTEQMDDLLNNFVKDFKNQYSVDG